MDVRLKEAVRLLKWAAEDFEKYGISNDKWYGDYEIFVHYDMQEQTNEPRG